MDATRTPEKVEADFVEMLNKQLCCKNISKEYIQTLIDLGATDLSTVLLNAIIRDDNDYARELLITSPKFDFNCPTMCRVLFKVYTKGDECLLLGISNRFSKHAKLACLQHAYHLNLPLDFVKYVLTGLLSPDVKRMLPTMKINKMYMSYTLEFIEVCMKYIDEQQKKEKI